MKTIIIYNSKTGFTKRYAEWIAEETSAKCLEFQEAKKEDLTRYDVIAFGGWALGGGISKLNWFKTKLKSLEGKKLVAFCVGASPPDSPLIREALDKNFTEEERKQVRAFYLPGGLDYDRMSFMSRTAMKMFAKSIQKRVGEDGIDQEMANMISKSYDMSDKKYIAPIVEYMKGL